MKRKTQKDKELKELQEGMKTLSDPPIDDLIAGIHGIDGGEWDHAKYKITETLRVLNDEELRDFFEPGHIPLLGWIDCYAEGRLRKKGWQDDSDSIWVWESVKKLDHLLAPDGKVNIDAVKTFLYTFTMTVSLLRSGAIRGAAMQKARQVHAEREKRCLPILKLCRRLMKEKPYKNAARLLNGFPDRERAVVIDGAKVFKEDWKACCCMPNGKEKSVELEKFYENYFLRIKQEEKNTVNS